MRSLDGTKTKVVRDGAQSEQYQVSTIILTYVEVLLSLSSGIKSPLVKDHQSQEVLREPKNLMKKILGIDWKMQVQGFLTNKRMSNERFGRH